MPTYGRLETAKDHPPLKQVAILNGLISGLERELAALKASRAKATKGCDHHFVPAPKAAGALEPTLCVGVAYAGYSGTEDSSHATDKPLQLDCTRCPAHKTVSLGERCPVCASELSWEYGNTDKETPTYFKHPMGTYDALVHLSCTCGFKAVAGKWDR